MQEQNDKGLHEWVRQTLAQYQPAPDAGEWQQMRRKLRHRFWWRMTLQGIGCVLVTIIGALLYLPSPYEISAQKSVSEINKQSLGKEKGIAEKDMPGEKRGKAENGLLADEKIFSEPFAVQKEKSRLKLSDIVLNVYPLDINKPNLQRKAEEQLQTLIVPVLSREESTIEYQMQTGDFGTDSTSYQVFSRNMRRWPDAVVVCDLTSSMYPYSTQIFTWFRKNLKKSNVQAVVFFTDCDSTGRETRQIGTSGQLFVSTALEPASVLPIMIQAARNTVNNHSSAENDLEALLFAQQQFPQAKHLILVADNGSPVKDMALLDKIKKPVHVILCGTTMDSTQAFQPDYMDIASLSGGSLHTIEDDIYLDKLSRQTWIRIAERYYKYDEKKKQFKLTRFRQRPKRLLGLFWW